MPFLPPSTLYDRIDQARWLTDMTRAELTALAERLYTSMDRRTTRAERMGLERAFWSLVAYLEHEPEELDEEIQLEGEAAKRIADLERRLGQTLGNSARIHVPRVDLADVEPDPEAWDRMPIALSRNHNVFPFELHGRTIHVAMSEPSNWEIWLHLHKGTGLRPLPHVAPAREIERAIKRATPSIYEPAEPKPAPIRASLRDAATLDEEGLDMEFSRLEGVLELCRELIGRSIAEGRSDLLILPDRGMVVVRAFTSSWEIVHEWPLNLWGPMQLTFRALAHIPMSPFETEASLIWPFMGADVSVWFHWYHAEGVPQLGIGLLEP